MSKENVMTKRWWGVAGLSLLVPVMLLAGCTGGEGYRGGAAAPDYRRDIPRPLSDTAPALRQWYTAPYFDPYETP
jgi:hypothetical protein